ncbi:PAS domain-containing protein [uncultured Maribacter sp.]|uniref:PAS domain-containing sensor histidine kinase n=1 Tax=uncultured Maribacter sp. TaxID=431308 RepID=UPI0026174033|nr:PAS domain-containing protein [uncultured Maribacter sp.]
MSNLITNINSRFGEDYNVLAENFFDNFWEIDLVSLENSWIDDNFWSLLGFKSAISIKNIGSWLTMVNTEDLESLLVEIKSLSAKCNSTKFSRVIRFNLSDLDPTWIKLSGVIITKKGTTRVFGSATNITEYKKKRVALEERVEYYKNVIKGGNFATWEYNYKTNLIEINERYAEIIGYKVKELQPLTNVLWRSFVHPDDEEVIDKTLSNLIEKKEIFEVEFRLKHKKGFWVWVLCSGEITKIDKEDKLHLMSGFMYDITSRKRNELLLLDYSNIMKRINSVAKVGMWEVKISNNQRAVETEGVWDTNIRKFIGVSGDYVPTFDNVIQVIKEGGYREKYLKKVKRAIEKGIEYDIVLPIITQPNNVEKWARVIGIPEYRNNECYRLYGFFQDIDKETRLAKELAIKEEEFRQTFDQASLGMGVIDLDNNLKKGNKSLFKIFKYSEEESYKNSFKDIVHPKDYKKTIPLIQEILNGKRDFFKKELRGITKFGEEIWVEMSLSAIKNDKGELIHMLNQMQDITQKKRIELKLADFSNLMSRINIVAKIGIWELNLENNTVYWDNIIKKTLGVPYDYEMSLQENITFFKSGYSREKITELLYRAITKGENFDVLLEVRAEPRKKYIWTRTTGIVEFKKGKCIRLYGFFQDVDKETCISKELAVKEEQLRLNFNQAAVGMVFINLEGSPEKVNSEMSRITGFSEKELLSFTFGDLWHPEDYEKAQRLWNKVIHGNVDSVQDEIRCIHKKGYVIWLSIIITAVKNDAGDVIHLFSQNQDISENKNLTLSLEEHNNRLVNFAHIVSHNLRSHASNISMLLDLVFKDYPLIMENEFLKNIKIVSDNMNDTIYDLNEIVELSSNINAKLTAQKLSLCLSKSMQNINSIIKESNAIITVNVDDGIEVLAIHAYLESIILNLITNAVKYRMPNRRLKINITAEIFWDEVVFSVEDNGLGMDLERYGDKLFGLYKIFHEHKDAKGVGLFIVKNQIEAMGGRIEVASIVDKGTKFKTYFKKA